MKPSSFSSTTTAHNRHIFWSLRQGCAGKGIVPSPVQMRSFAQASPTFRVSFAVPNPTPNPPHHTAYTDIGSALSSPANHGRRGQPTDAGFPAPRRAPRGVFSFVFRLLSLLLRFDRRPSHPPACLHRGGRRPRSV
jgi:hypothetical protein